jgi:hypothetical protein
VALIPISEQHFPFEAVLLLQAAKDFSDLLRLQFLVLEQRGVF